MGNTWIRIKISRISEKIDTLLIVVLGMEGIRKYCLIEQLCFPCFQEDQQDPVKLSLGLCYICDRDKWNFIKSSISKEDLMKHIQEAPKGWLDLFKEELKRRS